MKNVTLAIPDDLLKKARDYAKKNGTSLNEMIRDLLKKNVNREEDFSKKIEELRKELQIDSRIKSTREEMHER